METIMDIGLAPVTMRAVARDKTGADRLFRDVLGLKLVWVAFGLAILGVVSPLLRSDPVIVRLCYMMGISSAARSYLLTTRGLLQGLDRFDLEALLVVSDRLLLLVAGAGVLLTGHGLFALALAFILSRAVMLVVVLVLVRRFLGPIAPRFDRPAWRELQTVAWPLGFFMIAINTYTYVDTVILGVMRSDAEVGWYGAAFRVYEGLTYVPSILAAVLTPRLSHLFVHDRHAHRGLFMNRVLLISVALGSWPTGAVAVCWSARCDPHDDFRERVRACDGAARDSFGRRAVRVRHVDSARGRHLDQPRSATPVHDDCGADRERGPQSRAHSTVGNQRRRLGHGDRRGADRKHSLLAGSPAACRR